LPEQVVEGFEVDLLTHAMCLNWVKRLWIGAPFLNPQALAALLLCFRRRESAIAGDVEEVLQQLSFQHRQRVVWLPSWSSSMVEAYE